MKNIWKVLGLVFVIAIIILFFIMNKELIQLIRKEDYNEVNSFLGENRIYILFISLAIMLIQNTLSIIPLFIVVTLNNTLFGYFFGFFWSWITSIVASVLVFWGIRYVFKNPVIKKVNPVLLEKLGQRGFLYILQVRIFPFFPTNIINMVAAISTIRFKAFILGTAVGNAVYVFILTLVQVGFLSSEWEDYILVFIALMLLILYIVLKKYFYKKKYNRLRSN